MKLMLTNSHFTTWHLWCVSERARQTSVERAEAWTIALCKWSDHNKSVWCEKKRKKNEWSAGGISGWRKNRERSVKDGCGGGGGDDVMMRFRKQVMMFADEQMKSSEKASRLAVWRWRDSVEKTILSAPFYVSIHIRFIDRILTRINLPSQIYDKWR